MAAGDPEPQAAAPYATGGGGVVLEHRYGAVLLCSLLTGDPLTELGDDVRPDSVRFQAGTVSPVDDLLAAGRTSDGEERQVSIGVRRAPALTASDEASAQLLASYVRIITSHWTEVRAGRWRLALAVASPNLAVQQVDELTKIARGNSNEAEFRAEVRWPGRTNKRVRDRLIHFDKLVLAAASKAEIELDKLDADELTWRLLSSLWVRQLQLEGTSNTDRTHAVSRLRLVTRTGTPDSADQLFSRLVELVGDYAPVGAKVTEPMLRRELSGTPLADSPRVPRVGPGPQSETNVSSAAHADLARSYSPTPLVQEYLVRDYVEREEWLTRVDAFLSEPRGYLVVEGSAGVGKTTFLAHLAKSRGYPYGFITSELDDPGSAIVDLCHRLAEHRKLPQLLAAKARRDLDSGAADIDHRLGAAVKELLGLAIGQGLGRVVVIIDGVTSDDQHLSQILPRRLPNGGYVIIGQRPGGTATNGFESVAPPLSIEPSEQTTREMGRWVAEAIQRKPLPDLLRRSDITPREFVETLTRKAAGVWVYAHYVLSDVQRGTLDPAAIATIPADLWRYFARYFTHWRDNHFRDWASHDLPALATLAAAREDLPVKMLASVLAAGDETPPEIERLHRLLGQSWISFLSHPQASDVYRCYHQSVRDFVAGNLPVAGLTAQEQALQEELQRALFQANLRLAKRYRELLHDQASGTPERRSTLRARAAEHSAAVSDIGALDELLVRESHPAKRFGDRQQSRNDAYSDCERDGDVGGYLQIARAALEIAHQQRDGFSDKTIRYALIGSSVVSMAAKLPTQLLRAALARDLWAPSEVLRHVEAVPDAHQRAQQLAELLPYLTGSAFTNGAELLAEIGAPEPIEKFLGSRVQCPAELSDELMTQLLAVLGSEALQRITPALCCWMPPAWLRLLLRRVLAARFWDDSWAKVTRLCGEAAPPEMREVLIREIVESGLLESRKAMAVAPLVTLVEPERGTELATWAARCLNRDRFEYIGRREFFDPPGQNVAVADGYLAPVLPRLLSEEDNACQPETPPPRRWFWWLLRRENKVPEPAARADVFKNPELRARAHCTAASVAPNDQQRADHARRAYSAITALEHGYRRSELLVMLFDVAGHDLDADACWDEILHGHRDTQSRLLKSLLQRLSRDRRLAIVRSALSWVTQDEQPNLRVIKALRPYLSQPQIRALLQHSWAQSDTQAKELLLTVADEDVIQGYLDANIPPVGSKLGETETRQLKAVCAAPLASPQQLHACVRRVINDNNPYNPDRWKVLAEGLPRLDSEQAVRLAELAGVLADSYFHGRAEILAAIARALPEPRLPTVIAIARSAPDGDRQRIIGSVAERLSPGLLADAVGIARRIGDDPEWSHAVAMIVPEATPAARRRVAAATWPFRPDAPYVYPWDGPYGYPWDAFHAAASGLPATDTLDMLDALQQELVGNTDERARHDASRVLRASLGCRTTEVAARCARLATEHGLLDDRTVVRAILECADEETRQQVAESVWAAVHQTGGMQAPGRLQALIAILECLPVERVVAAAELLMEAAQGREKVSLLAALADHWPEGQVHAIGIMVPVARAAADSDDPNCLVLRAVAGRCAGDFRQELFDEVLSRLGPRAARYGDTTIDEVVREASPTAASLLRATLLDRLEKGERLADHLLTMLAAKLPPAEALAAVRDTLQSSAAPVRDDARRLIDGLARRMNNNAAQYLLELIIEIEDYQTRGELLAALAPALSPEQARRALSSLDGPLSSSEPPRASGHRIASAVVTARRVLASRLDPTERAAIIDDILRMADSAARESDFFWSMGGHNAPEWAAELVPDLVRDASPQGRELAIAIANQLHIEAAVAVLLAVAACSTTNDLRSSMVRRAADLLRGGTISHPWGIGRGPTKARLLSEAARASGGAVAQRLFAEALMAAEECTRFGNEQCMAFVDIAEDAPVDVQVEALGRAIMSYDPSDYGEWSYRGPDPLVARTLRALADLGPASDRVAATVAYGCRDKPRKDLLSRLAMVGWGAWRSLGPVWADDVALSLTQVRCWWP
jgi:hypothetical protein